jgi:hypothetical protein
MVEACPTASGAALAAQCILSGEAHYDCSSAAVYEFVLYFDGSCITRRGCHSSGWSSQQLCLKSRQLRRREPVIARQAHGRSERSRGTTVQRPHRRKRATYLVRVCVSENDHEAGSLSGGCCRKETNRWYVHVDYARKLYSEGCLVSSSLFHPSAKFVGGLGI